MSKRKIESFMVEGREFEYWMDKNGCMNCVNCSVDKDGYPRISYAKNKKSTIARFIYQVLYGELEPGQVARHKCDNRSCINPAHIIPGTQQDNIRDRQERGRGQKGTTNGRAKIKEEDVRHIRESTLSTSALARMYGLAHRTVSDIRRWKLWKHVA